MHPPRAVIIVVLCTILLLAARPAGATSVVNSINPGCVGYIRGFDAGRAFPHQYKNCLLMGVQQNVLNERDIVERDYLALKNRLGQYRRAGNDFYLLAAADCDQERRVRAGLEQMINQARSLERRARAAHQVAQMVVAQTQNDLGLARNMNPNARSSVLTTLLIHRDNTGVWVERFGRKLRVLQGDLRRCTVENRCGRPVGPPGGGGGGGGVVTIQRPQPGGKMQFDNPTVDGYALHACGSGRKQCSSQEAQRAADKFCVAKGYRRAVRGGRFSTSSSTPVKNIWTGQVYPRYGSVWLSITCGK